MERGLIELDRVGLLNLVAVELHVHPNDLIGRPYASSPAENQWQFSAASILRELRHYDLAPIFDGAPRASGELWQDMTRLHRLRDAAANTEILAPSPTCCAKLAPWPRPQRATSARRHLRSMPWRAVRPHCRAPLRRPDLVTMAAERAAWAARLSADAVMPAPRRLDTRRNMLATADWDDSITLSDKAIARVQREYEIGEPLALRMWGTHAFLN